MRAEGLGPLKDIDLTPDGKLRRYRVEGDKAGSANGWYVLHAHPILAGAFGSWKTGESHNWREARDRPPTHQEREQLRGKLDESVQVARVVEQAAVHEQARVKAERLWKCARPATNIHPLFAAKTHRCRWYPAASRDTLLIPARDPAGVLHTLQFIGADGAKRFLTGGRIAGCYFAMGRPVDALLLCEGYATGVTLHQATGQAVAVAFNCGNLTAVAWGLRAKFPALRITVCADNDVGTPGILKPNQSHRGGARWWFCGCASLQGVMVSETFPPLAENLTDFNDLAAVQGLDVVRELVGQAKAPTLAESSTEEWPAPFFLANCTRRLSRQMYCRAGVRTWPAQLLPAPKRRPEWR